MPTKSIDLPLKAQGAGAAPNSQLRTMLRATESRDSDFPVCAAAHNGASRELNGRMEAPTFPLDS